MSIVIQRPVVVMPTVAEDKAITAAAKADPDAQPLTPKKLQMMVSLKSVRDLPKPVRHPKSTSHF